MKLVGLLGARSAPILHYDVPAPHHVGGVAFGGLNAIYIQRRTDALYRR